MNALMSEWITSFQIPMGCFPARPLVPDVCLPSASEGFRIPVPSGYGPPDTDGYASVHIGGYAISPPPNPRKVR